MILCVDKKGTDRQVLKTMLWEEHYVLIFLRTWEELVVFLKTSEMLPDVVLMGLEIDELLEFKHFIQSLRRTYNSRVLPILVMIASHMERAISSVLQVGINDYILKPLKRIEIIHKLGIHITVRNNARTKKEADTYYRILNDVFPKHIISEMEKNQGAIIVEPHQSISVLFSDIVDFTTMSSCNDINAIVTMLDNMFSVFDDICIKHGVYKVETIGDAYMIVSGHDLMHSQDHADVMLQVGFDMLDAVSSMGHHINDQYVQIRIGIHSGPACSGVIGRSRPRYCFFGDTVNTASRMESHGSPGRIHISDQTYTLVINHQGSQPKYTFEARGLRTIKGKGEMLTYFVNKN